MATRVTASPATLGSAVVVLPDTRIGTSAILRLDPDSVGRVHISLNKEPSTTVGDYVLDEGESIEFEDGKIKQGDEIFVVKVSGTPILYFGLK